MGRQARVENPCYEAGRIDAVTETQSEEQPVPDRSIVRKLAGEHLERGDATGWFEALYAQANDDAGVIPWADLRPNPNLIEWLDRQPARDTRGHGGRALVIGCGLGDDAEELAR